MPPAQVAELTPMLRHYLQLKAQHADAILMYRMGDFYEMFFGDAREAAPILEVALTARHRGTEHEVPMCGVPYHAVEGYIGKLLRAGRKVAICDQMEDPAQARGLVRREVTRVVTPGTVSEPGLLEGKEECLLASLVWEDGGGAGAFLDVSTGAFFVRRWREPAAGVEDCEVLRPREVLLPAAGVPAELEAWVERQALPRTTWEADRWFAPRRAGDLLARQFGTATLRGFGLEADEPAVRAAAAALAYARETQQSELAHVRTLAVRASEDALVVDATSLANLEVLRSQREGGRQGSLLQVLDRTCSPGGGRRLRDWLCRPLRDRGAITARHDAVGELVAGAVRREQLRELLAGVGDLERVLSRAVLRTVLPREAAALRDGLAAAPPALALLADCRAAPLVAIAGVDPVGGLAAELTRVLEAVPAANLRDGGVIAAGVDPELDRCRSLARDSKRHILALESAERQRTGISSLKIRYNKVFGYYLEVSRANQHRVPDHYIRKQTLVNAERYVTPEVKELEEQILSAEERQLALEAERFEALRQSIVAAAAALRRLASALADLDALAAFADAAAHGGYLRPTMGEPGGPIRLRDSRHPVVERTVAGEFVPNDADLDSELAQIVVLTGPNMGGKSTYLRQVALLVLMAHAGSFVPAASAEIGVVDRIFTRVGASDDLARGESTFMVEMIETAKILHQATAQSLVILDEVGRGTATFDGLSLAWAIVEFLHQHRRGRILFATHYHELTELAELLPRVVNRTMAVREWEDRIVFLRRVVPGSADKSYGLHVARLAGLPAEVIERAAEVLANLEAQQYDVAGMPRLAQGDGAPARSTAQLQLFAPPDEMVVQLLREVDLDQLSPLAALNLLRSLQLRLGAGGGPGPGEPAGS